jgi:hypothetical protein
MGVEGRSGFSQENLWAGANIVLRGLIQAATPLLAGDENADEYE